eukprot:jgi/Bigna1/73016/fgenesh1_pg.22_\
MLRRHDDDKLLLGLADETFVGYGRFWGHGKDVNGGQMEQNTTWTRGESPYIVHDVLVIEPNVFLTIKAGVEVQCISPNCLRIEGAIRVEGTLDDPVIFKPKYPGSSDTFEDLQNPGWIYIAVKADARQSEINYAKFEGDVKGEVPQYLAIQSQSESSHPLTIRRSNMDRIRIVACRLHVIDSSLKQSSVWTNMTLFSKSHIDNCKLRSYFILNHGAGLIQFESSSIKGSTAVLNSDLKFSASTLHDNKFEKQNSLSFGNTTIIEGSFEATDAIRIQTSEFIESDWVFAATTNDVEDSVFYRCNLYADVCQKQRCSHKDVRLMLRRVAIMNNGTGTGLLITDSHRNNLLHHAIIHIENVLLYRLSTGIVVSTKHAFDRIVLKGVNFIDISHAAVEVRDVTGISKADFCYWNGLSVLQTGKSIIDGDDHPGRGKVTVSHPLTSPDSIAPLPPPRDPWVSVITTGPHSSTTTVVIHWMPPLAPLPHNIAHVYILYVLLDKEQGFHRYYTQLDAFTLPPEIDPAKLNNAKLALQVMTEDGRQSWYSIVKPLRNIDLLDPEYFHQVYTKLPIRAPLPSLGAHFSVKTTSPTRLATAYPTSSPNTDTYSPTTISPTLGPSYNASYKRPASRVREEFSWFYVAIAAVLVVALALTYAVLFAVYRWFKQRKVSTSSAGGVVAYALVPVRNNTDGMLPGDEE